MTSTQTHLAAAGMVVARRRRGPGMIPELLPVSTRVVGLGPGGTSPKIGCRPMARRVCCGPSISTARSTVSVSDEDFLAARILAALKLVAESLLTLACSLRPQLCGRSSTSAARSQHTAGAGCRRSARPSPTAAPTRRQARPASSAIPPWGRQHTTASSAAPAASRPRAAPSPTATVLCLPRRRRTPRRGRWRT